jgi:hypothetical protein
MFGETKTKCKYIVKNVLFFFRIGLMLLIFLQLLASFIRACFNGGFESALIQPPWIIALREHFGEPGMAGMGGVCDRQGHSARWGRPDGWLTDRRRRIYFPQTRNSPMSPIRPPGKSRTRAASWKPCGFSSLCQRR